MSNPANPYVGPRAIQAGEAFFGREREVRSLTALLVAERIVLLHSPSGAGKTSLIQAGFIPAVAERFNVLPIVRVNLEPPEEILDLPNLSRYMFSTLLSLEEGCPAADRLSFSKLADLGLDEYLRQRASMNAEFPNNLLIFDQFEEILTTSLTDQSAKLEFFAQLGDALQMRNRWALFAIREDYMGGLAPFVRYIPNRLSVTSRLGLLGTNEARQAIQRPASVQNVDFIDSAASQLVDDLRGIQVQQPSGSFVRELGPYIEPVQLQVVCYNLWESGAAEDGRIDLDDLKRVGSVDQALAAYYANSIRKAAETNNVDEHIIRQWFESHLITSEGVRSQVLKGIDVTEGLSNAVLRQLESAHLIRGETRAGKTWYELAHDRLVEPVQMDNEAWFEANLSLLQKQTVLWVQQNRGEGLLLRGKELDEAESTARSMVLTTDENDFLNACQQLRSRERRFLRQRRMIFGGLILSLILLIMAVLFGFNASTSARQAQDAKATAQASFKIAEVERKRAEEQLLVARADELAFWSSNLVENNFVNSLLLSNEAYNLLDTRQTYISLFEKVQAKPTLSRYLTGHSDDVSSVAFSPDGKILASGSYDHTVILWDVESGEMLGQPLEGHSSYVTSVAFSPDGKILASGSWDRTIILWDVESGEILGQPLEGHSSDVLSVAFSPDGKTLASGSADHTIILWNLESSQPLGQPFEGHTDYVYSVAFSPDGKILASGSYDRTVILWNVESGEMLGEPLEGHETYVLSVAFSPDGKILASGGVDGAIILWDVESGEMLDQPLEGHSSYVNSVVFSPGGKYLVSGGEDRTILIWDVQSNQALIKLVSQSESINSVAFSPDGATLASGSADNTVVLWNIYQSSSAIGQLLAGISGGVTSVAFSPDGKTLASGSFWGDTITLWDIESGQMRGQPLEGHLDTVTSVAFSPDGKTLASGSEDNSVILWDMESGQIRGQPFDDHLGAITSVAFSPDGRILASGSADNTIILWDVESGQVLGQPLESRSSRCIFFSPDGKILASGSWTIVTLWDVESGQPLGQSLEGHSSFVNSVAFSPDGKTLASGSGDGTIILWDVESGRPLGQSFKVHSRDVTSVAFSPDGKTLASGSWDGTVILWDVQSGQVLGRPLTGHSGFVYSVAFSPDGNSLASGGGNGIILWDLHPTSWIGRNCQRAGRNFTLAEWEYYFPGEAYRITCPQYPAEE